MITLSNFLDFFDSYYSYTTAHDHVQQLGPRNYDYYVARS